MLTLYTRRHTGGFAVEAALAKSGAAYERVNVPKSWRENAEFLAMSPLGQVPALKLEDGRVITESAALCLFIAERYPEAQLSPRASDANRPDFLRWMLFLSSVVYPAVLRLYYAPRYTTDPDGSAAVKAAALQEMERAFAIVDVALEGRDGLAGMSGIAEIYLLMLIHWHPDAAKALAATPNIRRVTDPLRCDAVLVELNAYYAAF